MFYYLLYNIIVDIVPNRSFGTFYMILHFSIDES